MDKQEYRTKLDEARKLIQEGDKEEAFYILDGMNWRRVHNVNALLSASVLYENEGRFSQAKELLELAHERSPIGRMIIYRLALLCIRLEEYDEAKEYYDEFIEIAPHDSLQYIIQYQLAKARGAEDITLISILEELKEHDFLEEWAYELAL
ncbi:MAG: tetratricopeptide repeat protein, partial [Lachnospiraceae bacterium]|nr:tetratricopeptide repeat protein [Lachnospiraceae bacterium]